MIINNNMRTGNIGMNDTIKRSNSKRENDRNNDSSNRPSTAPSKPELENNLVNNKNVYPQSHGSNKRLPSPNLNCINFFFIFSLEFWK